RVRGGPRRALSRGAGAPGLSVSRARLSIENRLERLPVLAKLLICCTSRGPDGVALPVHSLPVMASGADILVIDDDPTVRETVGDVLREHGHHVDRVERGEDALARIGESRPVDLAI